jgi:hypothetical protein
MDALRSLRDRFENFPFPLSDPVGLQKSIRLPHTGRPWLRRVRLETCGSYQRRDAAHCMTTILDVRCGVPHPCDLPICTQLPGTTSHRSPKDDGCKIHLSGANVFQLQRAGVKAPHGPRVRIQLDYS